MPEGGNWKDLLKAAEDGDATRVRYHLSRGVDPNFQHPEYFTAPIFEAIRNGHLEIVKILVQEGGAQPWLIEELTDDTTVEIALSCRRYDILDYLNGTLPKDKQWIPRHVLVTDGNMGIGKGICQQLLVKGHHVIFTCKMKEAAIATKNELHSATGNPKIDYIVGSLDSVKNVNAIVEAIFRNFQTVDTLIHCASLWSTQKLLNEDDLELSFMINYMARYILNMKLTPLLDRNGPSRVVFVSPDTALVEPDLNDTPLGRDFHWRKTVSKTVSCGIISFMSMVRNVRNSSITATLVQVGGAHNTMARTSSGCIAFIMGIGNRFWKDPSNVIEAPVWLVLEALKSKDLHGKVFKGLKDNPSKHSLPIFCGSIIREWEQWSADFVSRSEADRNNHFQTY